MAPHPRSIRSLTATLALASLGACASDKPPEPPPEVEAVAEEAPRPPADRTFDRDGVLARADDEVFNSPLPVESYTTTAGNRWAGYQNRHGYWEVIRFYQKNLGNRYNLEERLGGAKLTPKNGQGPEIYIPKPRKPSDSTRVYYFGGGASDLPPPPFIKNPSGGGPSGLASGSASKPSREPSGGDPSSPEGKNYVESVQTRPDGSQFIVMSPNPTTNGDPRRSNAPSGDRPDSQGEGNKPFAGTRKIEIPEGTLY